MITPDFERIRKAVAHEEPDRVPLIEALVEYPIQSKFLGREVTDDDLEAQVEFWASAGYDYIPLVVGMMTPGKVTENSSISRIIRDRLAKSANANDDRSWNLEYTSFIEDRRSFELFPWEEAAAVDISKFERVKDLLPPGMKVIAISGKIYTLSWMLMGFENFAASMLTDEQLVLDIMSKVAEIQIDSAERVLGLPHVGAVWAVDDIAAGTGTMISPQALRKYLFPWYRKLAALCHHAGKMFFYHSDGDMIPVIEDLIELGVDALHPIDPTAMDIVEIKEKYGDRLCLFGNVDTELLRSGGTAEIEAEVKRLLCKVSSGGGFCLGSGNSVPSWADIDNYKTMLQTVMKYGRYPILCE